MNTNEINFYCSRCDQPLKSEAQFAGVHIYCPACKHFFRIPKPSVGVGFAHIVPEYVRTRATYVPEGIGALNFSTWMSKLKELAAARAALVK